MRPNNQIPKTIYRLLLFVLLTSTSIFSQTQIGEGKVSGVWDKEGSPYIVNGNISIEKFQTLTIEPGVEVKFAENIGLLAYGRLIAVGSCTDSIRFTAIDTAKGWGGVNFINQDGQPIQASEIAFSIFSYGKKDVKVTSDTTVIYKSAGGAIAIINTSKVKIRNSGFYNNKSHDGGAIYISNSTPTIINSIFKKNKNIYDSKTENAGGTLTLSGSAAKIYQCEFTDNSTIEYGAALSINSSPNAELKYLKLYNNVSNSGASAVIISGSTTIKFTNSEIVGNRGARAIEVNNSGENALILKNLKISGNSNSGTSALEVSGVVQLFNCIIDRNISESNTIDVFYGDLSLINTVVADNTAPYDFELSYSNLYITNSIILATMPEHFDAGMSWDIYIEYSILIPNRYQDIDRGDGVVSDDPKFLNSELGNYHLNTDSPAIDAGNPDPMYNDIHGGYGTNRNDMGAYGGEYASWKNKPIADFSAAVTKSVTSKAIQFCNQSIGARDYSWDFDNDGSIDSHQENPLYAYSNPGTYSVKLIVSYTSSFADTLIRENYITISQNHVSGNVSGVWDVDTVFVDGDITIPMGKTLTINHGTVVYFTDWYKFDVQGQLIAEGSENKNIIFDAPEDVVWHGMRFYYTDDNSQPVSKIKYCQFTKAGGGTWGNPGWPALYFVHSTVSVSDSKIFHSGSSEFNYSMSLINSGGNISNTELHNVGGLYIDSSSTPIISSCHFDSSGISIYNSSPRIDSCLIEHSWNGSSVVGIYGYNSYPEISNTVIKNNSGGVSFTNSNALLKFVTIEDNQTGNNGGGGYFDNSNAVLTNVIVKGNTGGQSGGGLYFKTQNNGDTYSAVLKNCLIAQNTISNSSNSGSGAVFIGKYTGEFTNCTIADNAASSWAGVMTDSYSQAYLNNCIVWNNGNNLDFQAGGLYTYSIIQGNYVGSDTATTNQQNVDPLFRDAANGDYHLQSTGCGFNSNSPAIDAGHPAIYDKVLDCSTAGLGTLASDIGAYGGANNWWDKTNSNPPCYFSGNVSGVWDCDTIHVSGDILIPQDETLEITDSVKKVIFTGPYQIKVEGTLIAHGPENGFNGLNGDYITFTGSQWHGIYFNNLNGKGQQTSVIENCRFDNADKMDMTYQGGGAVAIYNSDSVMVKHSVFYHNKAKYGGAMYVENSDAIIEDCYFANNGYYTNSIQTEAGGAIFVKDSNPVLYKLQIIGNKSKNGGGAIEFVNSSPVVRNILVVKNITSGMGGAFRLANGASPKFVNTTIADNMANTGGAFYLNNNSIPTIINSILYGDKKPEIYLGGGTPTVAYSLVDSASSESYFGTGCLDTDPKFKQTISNYYYLSTIACSDGVNSPAIDAGHPDSLDAVIDCKQGLGTNRADMGYYGGRYSDITVGVQNGVDLQLPSKYNLAQNYPNPFNPSTKIKYSLPNNGFVTLKVYDILGEEVATLVEQKQIAGNYEINFDASNFTSGIYFYRIRTSNFSQVRKMILLK